MLFALAITVEEGACRHGAWFWIFLVVVGVAGKRRLWLPRPLFSKRHSLLIYDATRAAECFLFRWEGPTRSDLVFSSRSQSACNSFTRPLSIVNKHAISTLFALILGWWGGLLPALEVEELYTQVTETHGDFEGSLPNSRISQPPPPSHENEAEKEKKHGVYF